MRPVEFSPTALLLAVVAGASSLSGCGAEFTSADESRDADPSTTTGPTFASSSTTAPMGTMSSTSNQGSNVSPTTTSTGTAATTPAPTTTASPTGVTEPTTAEPDSGSDEVVSTVEDTAPPESDDSGGAATSGEDSTGSAPSSDEVPMTDHCAAVAEWAAEWSQWEEEVLLLVNDYRAEGANCDTEGQFGPADPLVMDATLRCSARLHSLDMYTRDFFDHDNPEGLSPFDRMEEAGFSGSYMGENIAYGQGSPEAVMEAWIESDGHCSNIMNPNFTLLGVGYHPGSDDRREGQHFWTQNFGRPLGQSGGGFGGR